MFDPFGGSGTVGKTAKDLDRYFFLTEKDTTYFSYMKNKFSAESDDNFPPTFLELDDFKMSIQ